MGAWIGGSRGLPRQNRRRRRGGGEVWLTGRASRPLTALAPALTPFAPMPAAPSSHFTSRRRALGLLTGGALTLPSLACGPQVKAGEAASSPAGSLAWAAAGAWRIAPERDAFRHPVETLEFWGLEPDMTVLEILPGRGWLTAILAPYLKRGGGQLIVAGFDPTTATLAQRETLADFDGRFTDQDAFGDIVRTIVSDRPSVLALPGSVDLAILANNTHTLMAAGWAERVYAQVFEALKPGGLFGIEQHRGASTGLQDPLAGSGYVQEEYVKALAQEAGFEFVAASDINSNPRDTRDHPFGVWTLPPALRTAPLGAPDNPNFDTAPYRDIGESDRMTLKFRRPAS